MSEMQSRPKVWSRGGGDFTAIEHTLDQLSDAPLTEAERPDVTIADRVLVIYTSGPRRHASHHRFLQMESLASSRA